MSNLTDEQKAELYRSNVWFFPINEGKEEIKSDNCTRWEAWIYFDKLNRIAEWCTPTSLQSFFSYSSKHSLWMQPQVELSAIEEGRGHFREKRDLWHTYTTYGKFAANDWCDQTHYYKAVICATTSVAAHGSDLPHNTHPVKFVWNTFHILTSCVLENRWYHTSQKLQDKYKIS